MSYSIDGQFPVNTFIADKKTFGRTYEKVIYLEIKRRRKKHAKLISFS